MSMTRDDFAASMARVDELRGKRGLGAVQRSPYGKKGGEGPTKGMKASTYRATAPDGTTVTRRSFYIHDDSAFMGVYILKGKWQAWGVLREPLADNGQTFVVAERIS